MADEGVLEGILGGGEDEAAETPVAADPAALAIAMRAVASDPALAAEAGDYFRRQSRYVELQTEHAEKTMPLLVSQLRLKFFTDRLRACIQIAIILAALAVVAAIGTMLADAVSSRSVVVESFGAPPALAASGINGTSVASSLLDQLTRLQAATREVRDKRALASAWANDIKIELPDTGISIGEIDRVLHERFGHDLHIGGDLMRNAKGELVLTVRGGGVLPKSFTGDELETLTREAAEYIYGRAEPTLYATYLINTGRNREAVDFTTRAIATVDREEQAYLYNAKGNAFENIGGDTVKALSFYEEALRRKPDYWRAWSNKTTTLVMLGREEEAWREGTRMRQAAGNAAPGFTYETFYILTWDLPAWRAALAADVEAHGGVGSTLSAETPVIAEIDTRLHDPAAARRDLDVSIKDNESPSIDAMIHFARGRIAAETGDTATAAAEMEAFGAAFADPAVSSNFPGYTCWIAPAEEAAGNRDKADAVLASAGDYVDCGRFRGDILAGRGDWNGAVAAYKQAIALAPDLPAGYYGYGVALLRHGDAAGAATQLAEANQRGPHWADPLKFWGDALKQQGRAAEAQQKYREAARYAPEWSALKTELTSR